MRCVKAASQIVFMLGCTCVVAPNAHALPTGQRCSSDYLTATADIRGRNNWASNWTYITPMEASQMNTLAQPEYVSFSNGCYVSAFGTLCSPAVPIRENGVFMPGLVPWAFCTPGCYTPTQRLMFQGTSQGIEDAAKAESRSVTALDSASTSERLIYSEQPIERFISGSTEETIYVLIAVNGRRLEVTAGHPMVLADGTLVKASTLTAGDSLLSEEGESLRLARVEQIEFSGTVWNVRPVSVEKADNILVAEGFLTGSERFQVKWADDHYRLFVREHVNVEAVVDAVP